MISLCTKYLKFQCLKGNSLLTEEEPEVFLNRWLSACLAELFWKKHFPFPFPIHMCLSRISPTHLLLFAISTGLWNYIYIYIYFFTKSEIIVNQAKSYFHFEVKRLLVCVMFICVDVIVLEIFTNLPHPNNTSTETRIKLKQNCWLKNFYK